MQLKTEEIIGMSFGVGSATPTIINQLSIGNIVAAAILAIITTAVGYFTTLILKGLVKSFLKEINSASYLRALINRIKKDNKRDGNDTNPND